MSILSVNSLVLWTLWAIRLVPMYTPILRVSNGLLRGVYSVDGSYAAYFSIPYGSAGAENRFQAPGPELKWNGVFDAVDESSRCLQSLYGIIKMGRQNCLTLNVYTQSNPNQSKMPVMVFFHGGGFLEGSGSRILYGPEFLVSKGVILVTVNYRLNIQGFLCLGIKDAPGNAGMKDQVAALKWVQRNIAVFNGDPDDVTIFGESAGSASVSYHLLSPISKGLFHKAIMQSGSSLAAWSFQHNPVFLASLLAKVMLYDTQDPHELYKIFISKTEEELIVTRVPRKKGNIILSELVYAPCVEKNIEGVEPFLTDLPINVLEKGDYNKVPLIIGTNSEEGLLYVSRENDTAINEMKMETMIPENLLFLNDIDKNELVSKITEVYIGDNKISRSSLAKLSRFYGEVFFNYPGITEAELHLKWIRFPVYSYLFRYQGRRNVMQWAIERTLRKQVPGATHADELFYLFYQAIIPFHDPMIERLTILWTNFAKFGDPTPNVTDLTPVKWEPLKSTSPKSLVIDDDFSLGPLWFNERLLYWKQVYEKYRRRDYSWGR